MRVGHVESGAATGAALVGAGRDPVRPLRFLVSARWASSLTVAIDHGLHSLLARLVSLTIATLLTRPRGGRAAIAR
jgi:hypothetical protein